MAEHVKGASSTPSERMPRSVGLVLAATAISAISSFVILLIVAPALGPAQYAGFSVYWSALFMLVGVLFGVQQESTRIVATSKATTSQSPSKTSVVRFATQVAAVLIVVIATTAWAWGAPLFGEGNTMWAIPLTLGAASYVLVAALNGILAGSASWRGFALLPVIDGLLRLALVFIVLFFGGGTSMLVWAVVIPFPISFIITFILFRREVRIFDKVASTTRQLTANSLRTMLASLSTAVLINGFPVILALFSGADETSLGVIMLALMLTRAPILVPLTALQSMLIARLSSKPSQFARLLVFALLSLTLGALLLATAAGIWGPPLLATLFGNDFVLAGHLLAGLVLASGSLGVLTVSGSASLARGKHNAFAVGWTLASLVAVLFIAFAPFELALRTTLALSIGPLVGALVHFSTMRKSKVTAFSSSSS